MHGNFSRPVGVLHAFIGCRTHDQTISLLCYSYFYTSISLASIRLVNHRYANFVFGKT